MLALMCPDPQGPDQVPVIIRTNARGFHHGPVATQNVSNHNQVLSWRVSACSSEPVQLRAFDTYSEYNVGQVK